MSDLAQPARLYRNIALIEFADPATAREVTAGPLGRYIVRRLSETAAVVDHAHFDLVVKALQKGGYTPRVTVAGAPDGERP
jgi:hypothetical protein